MELINKLMVWLKDLYRHALIQIIWPPIFNLYSEKGIDQNLIVFAYSESYEDMPDNMTDLYNTCKSAGYNCVLFAGEQNKFKRPIQNIKFQKYYARAKCVVVTDYYFPLYANQPNRGTKVVQLWHACGAFKKWGFSTLDLPWGGDRKTMLRFPMHNTYTDVIVSSPAVIPAYADAFRCSESIIKALGTPRTDIYFKPGFTQNSKNEVLSLNPEIGSKKIILYAPTFRGNSTVTAENDLNLDLDALKNKFGDEYVFFLKLHPFTASKFKLTPEQEEKFKGFLYNVSSELEISTAMCAADLLITDYSSLIFEYSLLNKPVIFWSYDLEEYERDRSFYFPYRDFVPGPIAGTLEELYEKIENFEKDFDQNIIKEFAEKYMSACDGHSTQRIFEYITFNV